jgi:hypothetical protein
MAKGFLGITLNDVVNFGEGMIERDRQKTEKRLEDTKERLIAERNNYLAMKKNKYDSEIKEFETENKKSKAIQSVNNQFAGQEITASQWGQAYLRETDATTYNNLIKTYEGDNEGLQKAFASYYTPNLAKFTPSTTRDIIDANSQEEIKKITADYGNQIKNAREDSSLIAKLLGERNTKITDIKTNKDEKGNGIIVAQEVIKETKKEEPSFTIKEQVDSLSVPSKFIEKGKILDIRRELNKSDIQKTFSKAASSGVVQFLNDNKIAKPQQFYKTTTTGEIEFLQPAGMTLNKQLGELASGAIDSFSNEKIYLASNKKFSNVPNVFNEANVVAKINDRTSNYTHIEQPKLLFKDTENIVGIVPWSIVDVNDTIGDIKLVTKADKKAVAKIYVDVLKEYTAIYNKDKDNKILETNQKFMNDLQSELLQLRGNSSEVSRLIQSGVYAKLKELTSGPPKSEKRIKITNPATGESQIKADTEANRALATSLGATFTELDSNNTTDTNTKKQVSEVVSGYMRPGKDILTPKIKAYQQQIKEQEGEFGFTGG